MSSTFWQERLTKCREQIIAYETVIDALTVKGMKSYTFNDGQTVVTVTNFDLNMLQDTYESLLNRCGVLETRCSGSGALNVVPGW